MLTEDQIEAMARANWPGIEWDDESLAESAHLREAFRAGVRAVISTHEAKAAPAVPQGEPVMWVMRAHETGQLEPARPHQKAKHPKIWSDAFPLYAAAPAATARVQLTAEQVSKIWKQIPGDAEMIELVLAVERAHGIAQPATPPQEPVTLTEAEIESIARKHGTGGWQTLPDMGKFARAIIAALREKEAGK